MEKLKIVILPFIIFGVIFSFSFFECKSEKKTSTVAPDSLLTIRLSVVGDIMCHSPQFNYARVSKDSFDFNPVFKEVKKYFSLSDFLLGNFETVTAGNGKEYSGYPYFNTPDDFVPALKNAGFHLLSTANNHALDQGEKGVFRTLKILNKYSVPYNGTFSSQRDRDSIRIFDIKGIRVAYLAYSYGTNGNPVPKDKPYLINLINIDAVSKDISAARGTGADIVIVHYHFGEEYKREPVQSQREAVSKTIKLGADIIIGGHPHVIEPVEYFKTINGKLDTGFVAYSMGNFVSNQMWRYSDAGLILSVEVTKNLKRNSFYISKVDYTPTWVYKGNLRGKSEYLILPLFKSPEDSAYSFLGPAEKAKMRQAFSDTKEILTKYTNRIEEFSLPK
jgi:poly-gamma-glutamate synthesis protein (capsule biosynthesis protein)